MLRAERDLEARGLGVRRSAGVGRERQGGRERSGAENGAENHRRTPFPGDGENPSSFRQKGILRAVIPTILLPSLAIGRWWVIPAAAVVWAALLLATGVIGLADVPAAGGLAAANAAVGVAVHQVLLSIVRLARRRPSSSS